MAIDKNFIMGYGAGKASKTSQTIIEETDAWLEENISQETGYVLDRTLSMENAAAPADLVGDLKSALDGRATALDALVKKLVYTDSSVYNNEYKAFCEAYGIPWGDTPTPEHSTETEWYDGKSYELTLIDNSYFKAANGQITSYNGWSRTDYVYCHGASSITFPACPQVTGDVNSCAFFDENKGFVANIMLSKTEPKTISVRSDAYYFGISSETAAIQTCVGNGIVPNA